jgi:hypothetical protein
MWNTGILCCTKSVYFVFITCSMSCCPFTKFGNYGMCNMYVVTISWCGVVVNKPFTDWLQCLFDEWLLLRTDLWHYQGTRTEYLKFCSGRRFRLPGIAFLLRIPESQKGFKIFYASNSTKETQVDFPSYKNNEENPSSSDKGGGSDYLGMCL